MTSTLDIYFAEPPPEEAEGGLDLAMRTIESYVEQSEAGLSVTRRATQEDVEHGSEPYLVHFHGLWQFPHSWMSRWCREHGVPYVVSPHGMLEPWAWRRKWWKKWPYYYLVERRHLYEADHVLATSSMEAEHLREFVPQNSVQTIPLAITEEIEPDYEAARRRRGWGNEEKVLVYLSRVHEKKGLHTLLEGLAALPRTKTQSLRLVVVGDGPSEYLNRLRKQEQRLVDRLPRIDWEGAVWGKEKWTYLQGADLFCLPTHSENFGIVILEACQVGTPVLTTTGTPWGFLEDWDSGLIVNPDVSSVRAALERYTASFSWTDADRRWLAERTRERFGMSTVGPQYVDLYKCVASEYWKEGTG